MRHNEVFLEHMSVGDILDYSVELFKNNFKQLSIISLICYAPFSLLSAYFSADSYDNWSSLFKNQGHIQSSTLVDSSMRQSAISTLFFFLSLILFFTVFTAADAAISRIIYQDAVYGRREKALPHLKEGFRKLGSLFVQRLLLGLILSGIFFVSFLLIGILFAAMIPNSYSHSNGFLYGIILLFIFTAIIVLTIFFTIRLVFGLNVIAIDNGDIGKSFSKSWNLTKGSILKTFVVFLFSGFIYASITSITSLSPFLLYYLLGKNTFKVALIASQFFITLLYPYTWAILTVTYTSLKIKKEGLDLELKVDKLLEAQAIDNELQT